MNDEPDILDLVEERCRALSFEYQKELERASHILRVRRAGFGHQPPRLFHYTSVESARQILGSGVFWATDCRYLNDPKERNYAGSLIQKHLDQASRGDVPPAWSKTLTVIGKVREVLVSKIPVYVACFCADGDVGSQWQHYGDNDRGLALGLDCQALFGRDINSSFGLMRVEYEPDDQEQHIEGILRMAYAIWRRGVEELGFGETAELSAAVDVEDWLRFELLVDAMGMKEPDFRREREWRAVAFGSSGRGELDVLYRDCDGVAIPYVELDLKTDLGPAGRRLPLPLVRHGSKLSRSVKNETRRMLDQLGYPGCEVG